MRARRAASPYQRSSRRERPGWPRTRWSSAATRPAFSCPARTAPRWRTPPWTISTISCGRCGRHVSRTARSAVHAAGRPGSGNCHAGGLPQRRRPTPGRSARPRSGLRYRGDGRGGGDERAADAAARGLDAEELGGALQRITGPGSIPRSAGACGVSASSWRRSVTAPPRPNRSMCRSWWTPPGELADTGHGGRHADRRLGAGRGAARRVQVLRHRDRGQLAVGHRRVFPGPAGLRGIGRGGCRQRGRGAAVRARLAVEVANSFIALPAAPGGLRHPVRFFQQQGYDASVALSSGAIIATSSWIAMGILFLVSLPFAWGP